MKKIYVKSYQADKGDCFLVKYDEISILVDTGTSLPDKLIEDLSLMNKEGKNLQLLILTHIDTDHIGGAIELVEKNVIQIENIWYNGYKQVFDIESELESKIGSDKTQLVLNEIIKTNSRTSEKEIQYEAGYSEAKSLEEILFKNKIKINEQFEGKKILSGMDYNYNEDISFYFLSPTQEILDKLKEKWNDELQEYDCYVLDRDIINMPKAFEFYFSSSYKIEEEYEYEAGNVEENTVKELANKKEQLDNTTINKSSFAFILSIGQKNLLFLGDSNPKVVQLELNKLIDMKEENKKFKDISLVKVSHHGSKYNITNDLLSSINTNSFLISTDGVKKKEVPTKPDIQSIAKIIYSKPNSNIYLNYPKEFYNEEIYNMIDDYNHKEKANVVVVNGSVEDSILIEI
ncbi:MBL fold metallo-hydrolase [Clostridium butyricum]